MHEQIFLFFYIIKTQEERTPSESINYLTDPPLDHEPHLWFIGYGFTYIFPI